MGKKKVSAAPVAKPKNSKLYDIFYEKGILYFILSFMIPFVIMLIAFHEKNMNMLWFKDGKWQETGPEQFLVVDLWHQYYPFFRVLREKLLTGGSFLYSWQNGMGTNFLALIAYYAASPLNWLSIFFDDEHTRHALMYILAAKVGFCGAFFSCFLRYTFNRKDFSIVGFSAIFALCSYTLGYYWNVMWFDTIALFPLVMQGVVAMCREKKWKLYTIALALSLISNYYIGFFTCIFTIFMFAASAIIEWQGFKAFFGRLWLIIRSSVIGLAMGGFILIPAYKALQLTHSVTGTIPQNISWENSWLDMFANLISYNEPTSKEGLPNFACGMLAITLIGVFLFAGGIKIREKISSVILLGIIAVSCNMNKLDYIWHGFHETNQLPYRFAFIFSFILAVMAYRAYDVLTDKGIKLYHLPLLLIGPAAIGVVTYYSKKAAGETFSLEDAALKSSLIITGAYILIIVCMKFIPIKDKKLHRAVMNLIITIALCIELCANAVIGVETVGSSNYESYPANNEEVQSLLSDMREADKELFYRTETTATYTLNDSSLYGYYGLSQFSSSANVSITKLFQKMGLYASEAGNRFYYRMSDPVVHSLFGVKYIISKRGALESDSAFLEMVGDEGSTKLYRNKYPVSLGFMVDKRIRHMTNERRVNPFEYKNDVMSCATGIDLDLFTAQPVSAARNSNVLTEKQSYGEYTFSIEDRERSARAMYEFAPVEGGHLYGYFRGNNVKNIDVMNGPLSVDSGIISEGYSITFPLGDFNEGNTAEITLNFEDDADFGSYTIIGYSLNEEVFKKMYDRIVDEEFEITEFSDTNIKGLVNAKNSGILYFSIPYEKGWSVYVDGEKAETFPVIDAMLGVEVGVGEHEIELKYAPEGFYVGLMASIAAVLLFVLFAVLEAKKKKVPAAEPAPAADENGEMADLGDAKAANDLGFAPNISPVKEENDKAEEVTEAVEEAVEAAEKNAEEIAEETVKEAVEEMAEEADKIEIAEEDNEKSESPDSLQGD